jgi:hypothetical protein
LDETYLNVNHSKDRTWYFEPDGPWVNKPAGKGARLIIGLTAKLILQFG